MSLLSFEIIKNSIFEWCTVFEHFQTHIRDNEFSKCFPPSRFQNAKNNLTSRKPKFLHTPKVKSDLYNIKFQNFNNKIENSNGMFSNQNFGEYTYRYPLNDGYSLYG